MKNIELLAPAGNKESLLASIYNGANAVYLGMSNFNARAKAQNFNEDNIREITRLAHLYGVKVNVTINTLINNDEIDAFLKVVKSAYLAKVDAFIVQDLGVASIIKKFFPNIVLHASTQMGIHNLEGARIAEELGFTRIVLSRETKLEDIKAIKQNTNLEIEYFVQGALCVAFSGNCYLSSLCHNQSGNRGKCLQLCRLNYSYDKNNFAYYLSPADLCLIKNLGELINAGVDSFKIEGRLRRPSYVAQSVRSYRKALDCIENNQVLDIDKEMKNLSKVFNRGEYIERAYLDEKTPDYIINTQCNNHIGKTIGKVLNVERFKDIFKITIESNHPLAKQDGLKFFDKNKEIASVGVGNFEKLKGNQYIIYSKRKPTKNAKVNLISDFEREQYLTSYIKKLQIEGAIFSKENEKLKLQFKCADTIINCESDYICPNALNTPTSKEEIINQINKLNDTHFLLNNLKVQKDAVFIPKSILNELRRNAVQTLENKIIEDFEKNILVCDKLKIDLEKIKLLSSKIRDNIIVFNDIEQIKDMEKSQHIFIYSPILWNKANIIELLDKLHKNGVKVGINLPIIANHNDLKIIDSILTDINYEFYLISNNIWSLKYISEGFKVIAGYNHNVFNDYTYNKLMEMGAEAVVQSVESESSFIPCAYGYNGKATLMTFCHCPYKTKENTDCANCPYEEDKTLYTEHNESYLIRRSRISLCYFEMITNKFIKGKNNLKLFDIRNLNKNERLNLLNNN